MWHVLKPVYKYKTKSQLISMSKSEWNTNLEPWPELDANTWEAVHVEWPELDNHEWPEVNTGVWEIEYPEWISDTANSRTDEAPTPEPV